MLDHHHRQRRLRLALAPGRRGRGDGRRWPPASAPTQTSLAAVARSGRRGGPRRPRPEARARGGRPGAPAGRGAGLALARPRETRVIPALLCQVSDPPLGLFVRGRASWQRGGGGGRLAQGQRLRPPGGAAAGRGAGRRRLWWSPLGWPGGSTRRLTRASSSGGGSTVAVWGTGPDRVYPPEHREPGRGVAATGALITEYPPGTPPRRAPLSRAQPDPCRHGARGGRGGGGGAARAPWSPPASRWTRGARSWPCRAASSRAQSLGPNALLRLGARPVLTPRDMLEVLPVPEGGGMRRLEPRHGGCWPMVRR